MSSRVGVLATVGTLAAATASCVHVTPGYRLGIRKPRYTRLPETFICQTRFGVAPGRLSSMYERFEKFASAATSYSRFPFERNSALPQQTEYAGDSMSSDARSAVFADSLTL